jgi:hypothetical protein
MLEYMCLRRRAPKSQSAYIRAVCRFTAYLDRPLDTATVEDLRNFLLYLVDQGTSPATLNANTTGQTFFCETPLCLMGQARRSRRPGVVLPSRSGQRSCAFIFGFPRAFLP